MSEEQFIDVWIFTVCSNLSSLLLPFFPSAVYPLSGSSTIISENPNAFGLFECPYLYCARKMFNFVPCKLIMISKHDFIKAAIGLCS